MTSLASATSLLLGLDYDGTLTPIAAHPASARLPARTRRLLKRLAGLPGVRVALVSGRSLHDLKRMVGVRGLYYVGNHGLELQGPALRYVHPAAQASRLLLKRIAEQLTTALQPISEAWVEEKGLTVSLHWRNVPQSAHRLVHRLAGQCLAPHLARGAVRMTPGKRVMDIRPPVAWGKGESLAWLVSQLGGGHGAPKPLVVYVGDDHTDEGAFRIVNRLRGLSVVVGRPAWRSAARYRLRDPREVHAWLETLGRAWRRAGSSASKGEVEPRLARRVSPRFEPLL